MESLGFTADGEGVSHNDYMRISDLQPRNILKSSTGMIYVVDADFAQE